MARKFFYVCAGLFLLAGAYALGARSAGAQAPTSVGRFQLFQAYEVRNGVEFKTVMLIDSATGLVKRHHYGTDSKGVPDEGWLDTIDP